MTNWQHCRSFVAPSTTRGRACGKNVLLLFIYFFKLEDTSVIVFNRYVYFRCGCALLSIKKSGYPGYFDVFSIDGVLVVIDIPMMHATVSIHLNSRS